jgi:O-antigen ligase
VNFVYLVLLALAWVGIQCAIGGTRLVFSLPAYALIALAAILSVASIPRKKIPPDILCIGSTLLLGGWILYRGWTSPVEYLALPDFTMMIGCLMVYLLTAFYLTETLDHSFLIAVLWIIAGAEFWVAMVQFLKEPNFMLFGLLRPLSAGRPSGLYISPNNFAGFMDAVAILSVSLGIWSRWPAWSKILSLYIAAVCLVGAAVSGSRGGYFDAIFSLLCFAGGSLYVIRVAEPRRFLTAIICTIAALAATLGVATFLMGHSQLLTTRMQNMVAKDVRFYNWQAAIDHIRVSPMIGTGAGTHLIFGRLFRRPEIQADPVHAHCDYLELLAEYGMAGGGCMLLFLGAHIYRGFRSLSQILRRRIIPSGLHRSNAFAMQLGALCAVAGLGIHSIFDFDMHIPGNALIFAFIFGVLANPGLERRPTLVDRRILPWAKALAPILGLYMLWRVALLYPSEYNAELSRISLRDHRLLQATQYGDEGLARGPGFSTPLADDQTLDPMQQWLKWSGGNPKNPNLYFYIGEANLTLGIRFRNPYLGKMYYERAAAAFQAGLKVFPQDENMLVRYAQALDGLNQHADAEEVFQRALSVDPNLGALHDLYIAHLRLAGDTDKADALSKQWSQEAVAPVDSTSSTGSLLGK